MHTNYATNNPRAVSSIGNHVKANGGKPIVQFSSVQFVYLCLNHTYMQIIIKKQRRPAKGL